MKCISEEIIINIVALLKKGLSMRKIARRLGVGKSTVFKVKKLRLPDSKGALPGRPKVLNLRKRNLIARKVVSGELQTASDAKNYIKNVDNTSVSSVTVRNYLKEAGLKSFVRPKKPFLSIRHIKQRLKFALKYQHWTEDDWMRVIWSDESKVNRFGSDGTKWGWKKPNSNMKTHHVHQTVKHGGGSLMIWGCMSVHGVGNLEIIDGALNAEYYCRILGSNLASSISKYGDDLNNFIFQHDNDPKHTSRLAKNWLLDNSIEVLDWPAQSPDLNPIEHLWFYLKNKLSDYEESPASMHGLRSRLIQEWQEIPKEVCVNLIKSMPKRISAVLKSRGGYTKY